MNKARIMRNGIDKAKLLKKIDDILSDVTLDETREKLKELRDFCEDEAAGRRIS